MTNPFAHDTSSNARDDFSFFEDQGVPAHHVKAFANAMGAPNNSLSEEDYRFPDARPRTGDEPIIDGSEPERWQAIASPSYSYFPKPYAP